MSAVGTDVVLIALSTLTINVSDAAVVTDNVAVEMAVPVSVVEVPVAVDAVIAVSMSDMGISVNDPAVIADVPSPALGDLTIDVSDAAVVTDSSSGVIVFGIDVSDPGVVSDLPTVSVADYEININDPGIVVDVPAVSLPDALEINVNDSITVRDVSDFNERYENPSGYDQTWAGATVGAGSTYDPNQITDSVSGAPASWGDECLQIVTASGENCRNRSLVYDPAYQSVVYSKFEVIIESESLSNDTLRRLSFLTNSIGFNVCEVRLNKDGSGNLRFRFTISRDGSTWISHYSINTVSVDTLYRIEIKYDADNDAWAWRIDGVDQPNDIDSSDPIESEGTLTTGRKDDIRQLYVGADISDSGSAITCYIDNVVVNTEEWIGDWVGVGVEVIAADLEIDVNEQPVVTDVPTASLPDALEIDVNDSAIAVDVPSLPDYLEVNVNEQPVVTDVPTASLPDALEIDINEPAVPVDVLNYSVVEPGNKIINIPEPAVVSDVPTVSLPDALEINVLDSVVATEVITINADFNIDVSDPAVATEAITVEANFNIEVSDPAIAGEAITVRPSIGIDISDAAVVTEAATIDAAIGVDVNDPAIATESLSLEIGNLQIDVIDPARTTESITLAGLIGAIDLNISESVIVTDVPTVYSSAVVVMSLTSGIEETLALDSGIEETLALTSGIASGVELGYGIFNGASSFVTVEDDDVLTFSATPFSFAGWIWVDSSNNLIMQKGNSSGDKEYVIYMGSSHQVIIELFDQINGGDIEQTTSSTLTAGRWNHLVATHDGGTAASGIKVYIDGVLAGVSTNKDTGTFVQMQNVAGEGLQIGSGYNTFGLSIFKFDGRMKNIKLFNIELTQDQIDEEFAIGTVNENLVAHYKLYNDVNDSGPNSLDGVNTDVTFGFTAYQSLLEIDSSLL